MSQIPEESNVDTNDISHDQKHSKSDLRRKSMFDQTKVVTGVTHISQHSSEENSPVESS